MLAVGNNQKKALEKLLEVRNEEISVLQANMCEMENQVMNLKDKLSQAEVEILHWEAKLQKHEQNLRADT